MVETTLIGKQAEALVAKQLETEGYRVLAKNWRTKSCEVDVVAKKANIVYLVEVKFRKSNSQGDGFSYITPKKVKQMTFASQVWCQDFGWDGDIRLIAASVSGQDGSIQIIELD